LAAIICPNPFSVEAANTQEYQPQTKTTHFVSPQPVEAGLASVEEYLMGFQMHPEKTRVFWVKVETKTPRKGPVFPTRPERWKKLGEKSNTLNTTRWR